jgi:hypothetical protein
MRENELMLYSGWMTVTLVALLSAALQGVAPSVIWALTLLQAVAIVGAVAPDQLARVIESLCDIFKRR